METLLASTKRIAEQVEIIYVESKKSEVKFKANRLHSLNSKFTRGVGLRVIKSGRLGFACTTNLSKTSQLQDKAISSAKYGELVGFDFPTKSQTTGVRIKDPAITNFSDTQAVEIGNKTVELIKQCNPQIQVQINLVKGDAKVQILNSSGLNEIYEKTLFTYEVTGFYIHNNSFIWATEEKTLGKLHLETEQFVDNLLNKVRLAQRVVPLKSKLYGVIFAPSAMPSLLKAIEMGINGKIVQKGSSPLTNKLNQQIFDSRVTIHDNGILDYGYGSTPVDGEGTPRQITTLVENGYLKNFLFDLRTAYRMNTHTTASADRRYDTQPVPGPSNLVVQSGNTSFEELIRSVKEGILVYSVLGSGQSNLLAGDFSLNINLGYKIENGEIVGRVKDVMIAGNVYELLNQIECISQESEEHKHIITPAFYFKSINVTSKH